MEKKDKAKAYYKIYYQNHRQQQIDAATKWYLASEENRKKHAVATLKYLNKNKKDIYERRKIKSLFSILMKELLYKCHN